MNLGKPSGVLSSANCSNSSRKVATYCKHKKSWILYIKKKNIKKGNKTQKKKKIWGEAWVDIHVWV